MAGLLIIAHEPLASALRDVASHVYRERADRVASLDIPADAQPEVMAAHARTLLQSLRQDEVLVLVDVPNATPGNVARRLAFPPGVRVLAGVNVPMLWRVLCYLDEPLDSLVAKAMEGAAKGVVQLSEDPPASTTTQP